MQSGTSNHPLPTLLFDLVVRVEKEVKAEKELEDEEMVAATTLVEKENKVGDVVELQ